MGLNISALGVLSYSTSEHRYQVFLLQADGVEEPFRMFTGSWRTPTTMKYFGLSESVIKSDVGYVLVKLVKPRLTMKERYTLPFFSRK